MKIINYENKLIQLNLKSSLDISAIQVVVLVNICVINVTNAAKRLDSKYR